MKFQDGDKVRVNCVVRRDELSRRLTIIANDEETGSDVVVAAGDRFVRLARLNLIELVQRADPKLEHGDQVQAQDGNRYVFAPLSGFPARPFLSIGPYAVGEHHSRDEITGPLTKLQVIVPDDDTEDGQDR